VIEKVAAWSLGLVLVVSLLLSAWLVFDSRLTFGEFGNYWTPALTALIAWVVKR
jgi:hypothetical protein